MNYIEWNDLIARKFFNEEMAGREVLLYVNEEIIKQLGSGAGVGVEDFIRCIKTNPFWVEEGDICKKALQSYVNWRDNQQLEYPPYIAYLAFFSLAATIGGDFDSKAYYPRFWKLLDEHGRSGTPRHFDKLAELWVDLEKWSTEDKNEELGRFTARIRGGWVHVGRPLSQTLLSDNERESLLFIFDEAELDPTNLPPEVVIRWTLLNFGKNKLEKRTLRLLDPAQDDNIDMANALIEFVLGELAGWDSSVPDIEPREGRDSIPPQQSSIRTGLRICIEELDRVSGSITTTLRLKTNRPFPDTDLNFEYDGRILSCKENIPNWSTKLMNIAAQPQKPFNAASLDWSTGVKLEDKKNTWRATLKGAPVRLFLPGSWERLPGWIESQHLERNCEFIVTCHKSKEEVVHRWGNSCCEKFAQISAQELPYEWSLFEGGGAHESCDDIDVLTLSTQIRLLLQGGIKTGRGNTYLKFGPPLIVLEGGDGSELVTLNGRELKREDTSVPHWRLPPGVPIGTPLIIDVYKRGEQNPFKKQRIMLEEPNLPSSFEGAPMRDSSGLITDNISVPYARGAVVSGTDHAAYGIFQRAFPTYLSNRIVFLGSRPGEIADWPKEAHPEEWKPVWALAKSGKDKWIVNFCGQPNHISVIPDPSRAKGDIKTVKRWKAAIWVKRKRTKISPLLLPKIQTLWAKYMEVAEHVV
jgi:hypothetical protein